MGVNPFGTSVDSSKVISMTMSLLMKALDMDSNAMRLNALKKKAQREKEMSPPTVSNQPTERVTCTSSSGAVKTTPDMSRKRAQPSSVDTETATPSDKKCPRLSEDHENNSVAEARMNTKSDSDASKIIVIEEARSDTLSELDNIPTEKEKPSSPSDHVPGWKRPRGRAVKISSRRSVRLITTSSKDPHTDAEKEDLTMLEEVTLINRVHFPRAAVERGRPHVSKTLQSKTPPKGSKSAKKTGDQQSRREMQATNVAQEKAKTHPFLPPSAANLDAFKKLLLKRRDLISSASKNYNKSFYKKHRDDRKLQGGEAIKSETISVTTKELIDDPLAKIRETSDFKRLKSRFESLMIWPAFLSATVPPSLDGMINTETRTGPGQTDMPQETLSSQEQDKYVFKTKPRKKTKVGVHSKSFYKFQMKSREYKEDFKRRRLETVALRKKQGLIPIKPKSLVAVDLETFKLPPLLDADGNPVKRKKGRQPGSLGNIKWLRMAENSQPRMTRQTRSGGPADIEPP